MGKVSNPYSLKIEDNYNSYADISNPDDDYNFICILESGNYGNGFGSLVKNSSDIKVEFIGSNVGNNRIIFDLKNVPKVGIFHFNSEHGSVSGQMTKVSDADYYEVDARGSQPYQWIKQNQSGRLRANISIS